mgnify:CR=1 FL=1
MAWLGAKTKATPFFLQCKDLPQIFVIGDMTLFDRFYNARIFAANPGIQEMRSLWFPHIISGF